MKKIIAIGVSVLIATTAFAAKKEDAEKKVMMSPTHVLGTVNGEEFYMSDWSAEFSSLNEQVKAQGTDSLLVPLRDAIVNKMAVSAQAVSIGLDKTNIYKIEMSKARRDVLTRLYLAEKVSVETTDKELEEEYKAYKKVFKGAKQVSASHILVKTRNDADVVIKALNSGHDFSDLAKKKSIGNQASNGGKLGFFSRGQMLPDFEKAVYKLKDGKYTLRPVKTKYGWHVIKRDATRDLKPETYKKVKNALKQSVYQKKLARTVENVVKKHKIVLYDLEGNVVK